MVRGRIRLFMLFWALSPNADQRTTVIVNGIA
jgi:hypothetical protein